MALSQWVLTDEDVRDLLEVLERSGGAEDGDIFYSDVLAGLRRLVPCDDISFQLMEVAEQRLRTHCVTDDGVERGETVGAVDEWTRMFWREFWNDDGCAGGQRTGDFASDHVVVAVHPERTSREKGLQFFGDAVVLEGDDSRRG